jgi:hypothetical protein
MLAMLQGSSSRNAAANSALQLEPAPLAKPGQSRESNIWSKVLHERVGMRRMRWILAIRGKRLLHQLLRTQRQQNEGFSDERMVLSCTKVSIGLSLRLSKYAEGAKRMLEEVLRIEESRYGTRANVEVVATMQWLADCMLKAGDPKAAQATLKEALRFQERHCGTRERVELSVTMYGHAPVRRYLRCQSCAGGSTAKLRELLRYTRAPPSWTLKPVSNLGQGYCGLGLWSDSTCRPDQPTDAQARLGMFL